MMTLSVFMLRENEVKKKKFPLTLLVMTNISWETYFWNLFSTMMIPSLSLSLSLFEILMEELWEFIYAPVVKNPMK